MKALYDYKSKWLRLKEIGIGFHTFIEFVGVRRIAFYNYSEVATLIYREIKDNELIELRKVIDLAPLDATFEDTPISVQKLEDIQRIDDVDMIIVTIDTHLVEIYELLSKLTDALIVPYETIVDILYKAHFGLDIIQDIVGEYSCRYLYFHMPNLWLLENHTAYEELLLDTRGYPTYRRKQNVPPSFDGYDYKTFKKIISLSYMMYQDYKKRRGLKLNVFSPYQNIIDDMRAVAGAPEQYVHTIYVIGTCCAQGAYAEDAFTVASQLQKLLNANCSNYYRVENYAIHIDTAEQLDEVCKNIRLNKGDIILHIDRILTIFDNTSVLYLKHKMEERRLEFVDMQPVLNSRQQDDDIYLDTIHMGAKGYKYVAEKAFEILKTHGDDKIDVVQEMLEEEKSTLTLQDNQTIVRDDRMEILLENQDFHRYLTSLESLRRLHDFENVGAVVMNCNPFTYGHEYLISEACKRVEFLYIFVVSENKSFFPFEDRIELVKENTKDRKNIEVLPSGEFIISNLTFEDYFSKEMRNVEVNPVFDVEIFGRYIAPALGICKRFVGREPYCNVTNSYNWTMKKTLPKYGVELIEIERIKEKDIFISASHVRKLLGENKYDEIKKIVPDSTFQYLERNYMH